MVHQEGIRVLYEHYPFSGLLEHHEERRGNGGRGRRNVKPEAALIRL